MSNETKEAMPTRAETIFDRLKEPFPADEIEWRAARSGFKKDGKPWVKVLAYINARAVMDRLDEVVGPENWSDSYRKEGNATICALSIKIGDQWVSKQDGADDSDIEAVKGGLSGALKRAAVKWGVSRYLYNLTEDFGQVVEKTHENSDHVHQFDVKDQAGNRQYFFFLPPKLPAWALPSPKKVAEEAKQKTEANTATLLEATAVSPFEFDVLALVEKINNAPDNDALRNLWLASAEQIAKLDLDVQMEVTRAKDKRKAELNVKGNREVVKA